MLKLSVVQILPGLLAMTTDCAWIMNSQCMYNPTYEQTPIMLNDVHI